MGGVSPEKRERLKELAKGEFLQSSDPVVDAFLKRMEEEGGPVFSDVYCGDMSFFNAPRRSDLDAIDIAVVGVPFEASAPVRGGTRLGPRSFREWSRVRGPIHDAWITIPFAPVQCRGLRRRYVRKPARCRCLYRAHHGGLQEFPAWPALHPSQPAAYTPCRIRSSRVWLRANRSGWSTSTPMPTRRGAASRATSRTIVRCS